MEFLDKLDNLIENGKQTEAEVLIEDSLYEAIKNKKTDDILIILNEALGFFRERREYDTLLQYINSLLKILKQIPSSIDIEFISFINIANAYRAMGKLNDSEIYFKEALNISNQKEVLGNKYLSSKIADLYNNYALLCQEQGKYNESILYLDKSISLLNDEYKMATAYTNMAISYLKERKFDETFNVLSKAKVIYDKDAEKEYHYSGFLHALASYYEAVGKIDEAALNYKYALSYLDSTTGKTKTYFDTLNHIKDLENKYNKKFLKSLIDVKKEYYNKYFKDYLLSFNDDILNNIVVGVFFFGSELLGFDDLYSLDHDAEASFSILLNDNIDESIYREILKKYNEMPKHYDMFYNKNDSGRFGVFYIKDYLKKIGIDDLSRLNEESIYFIKNYEIFMDKGEIYKKIVNKATNYYEYHYFDNLYKNIIELCQIYEYNIPRMLKREELESVAYLKNVLNESLVRFYFRLCHWPYVFVKWNIKRIKKYKKYPILKELVLKSFNIGLDDNDYKKLSNFIIDYLYNNGLIEKKNSDYVLDYQYILKDNIASYYDKYEIVMEIVNREWKMFDKVKNEGGRADCQDNFEYFSLMRRSQYFTWNKELLKSYLSDLKKGVNLIELKYAYMEESTAPEEFAKIKNQLPFIDEKRKAIQEEIISLSMEMLEEFLKLYPKAIDYIRVVHTKDDSSDATSYETYLRGEISTYSPQTLIEYAKFIINMNDENKNIVFNIMRKTCLFSGIDIDIYKEKNEN